MSLRLTIVRGQDQDRSVDLRDDAVTIGRASDCELPIRGDGEVSRRHAIVEQAPDGAATIRDLNSTNGTFVDGQRISGPAEIAGGVRIRVGDTEMLVAPLPEERTAPGTEPWGAASAPAAPPPYPEPAGDPGGGEQVRGGDPLAGPVAQGDYGPPPQAGGPAPPPQEYDQGGYEQPPPYEQPPQQGGYDQPEYGYDQPGQGGHGQDPGQYPQQPDWRSEPEDYGRQDQGYQEHGGTVPPPVAPPPVAPGGPSIPGAPAPYADEQQGYDDHGGGYGPPPPVQQRAPRRSGQGGGGGNRNLTALIAVGALIGVLVVVVVILLVSGVV